MPWDEKIIRRLRLKDLQTLLVVAEAGNIGKAASRLNYSQPAVSKALASLERTVGKRLLERGRRGVELTAYGQALLRCGTEVVNDLRKGIEELDFIADPTSGEVHIGCTEPVSMGLVSAVVDRIAHRYPRIVSHIVSNQPPDLFRDLEARKIDLVISRMAESDTDKGRHIEVLYDEPVVIVAGLQHRISRKRHVEFSDLADELWALPPANSFISILLAETFRDRQLGPPRTSAVIQSPFLRLTLASRGTFLTVVPDMMLRAGLKQLSVKVLPIDLPGNRRPVGIVTLKNRPLSPVAQLIIEQTRAVTKTWARTSA